jgi:hypothetical protein
MFFCYIFYKYNQNTDSDTFVSENFSKNHWRSLPTRETRNEDECKGDGWMDEWIEAFLFTRRPSTQNMRDLPTDRKAILFPSQKGNLIQTKKPHLTKHNRYKKSGI